MAAVAVDVQAVETEGDRGDREFKLDVETLPPGVAWRAATRPWRPGFKRFEERLAPTASAG
jgi:hypothetical protein